MSTMVVWPVRGDDRASPVAPRAPRVVPISQRIPDRRHRSPARSRSPLLVSAAQGAGLAPGPAPLAPHRRQAVDQRQELRDVVSVPGRQLHPQRGAVRVGQHVVLRAQPSTVNQARTDFWGCFAPAWPARARRQRGRRRSPGGPPPAAGPAARVGVLPCSVLRSSIRLRPGCRNRRSCFGSNGSITAHSSSLTSHGFRRATVTPKQHGITHLSTVPHEDHSARTPKSPPQQAALQRTQSTCGSLTSAPPAAPAPSRWTGWWTPTPQSACS